MKPIVKRLISFSMILIVAIFITSCGTPEETPECEGNKIVEDGVCVDATAPVIVGEHNLNYVIGEAVPNYLDGITASDDVDGDVSTALEVDASQVDLATAGEYTVIVSVSDTSGNDVSTSFTITVTEAIPDYEALLALDLLEIDIASSIHVVTSIIEVDLPTSGTNGSTYVWTTSHPDIISTSGFVQNPPLGGDPVDVTLTVEVSNHSFTEVKDFVVTVNPKEEVTVTSSTTIRFTNATEEYEAENQTGVEIFFVDDGDVPYMDIETYIDMMDGVLYSDSLSVTTLPDDTMLISYHPTLENYYLFYPAVGATPSEDYEFTALFDFTANTVTFSSYMFFQTLSTMRNPVESEGINVTGVEFVDGEEFTIPLNHYNFDILTYNDGVKDNYLVPYHLLDLLFTTTVFYNNYYKPEGIIGEEYRWDINSTPLISSEKNGDPIPYDVRLASYNLLMMSLDYFSTIKEKNGVTSYKDEFVDSAETIITASDSSFYTKLANFVRDLDTIKASGTSPGYYTANPYRSLSVTTSYGPRSQVFYDNYDDMLAGFIHHYGAIMSISDLPEVRYIDNDTTAIFYFYEFNRDTSDIFKSRLDALPATVENVVIDLTLNLGGNVGAMYRVFGYMTDDPLTLSKVNERNGTEITYTIENTLPTYDYNWYIASSGVTRNSGNAFIGVAKLNNLATIIGTQSYGSSSFYDIISLPCGFIYYVPAYNTAFGRVGNEIDGYTWVSLEDGVAPDYIIDDIRNDQDIIDTINEHQGN